MKSAPRYLDDLNKEQKAAVTCGIGPGKPRRKLPLLIDAGAGCGKTTTLAACVAYTIDCGGEADQMMVCSFTRKAASELVERVRKLRKEACGVPEDIPYAGTFHSIALKLLRRYGQEIGLRTDFSVVGKDDALELLARIQKQLKLTKSCPRARDCLNIYSYRRNARISLKATLEDRFGKFCLFRRGLSELLSAYKAAKKKQNLMDYDDLLFHFARLLRDPFAQNEIRRQLRFIFIDEFQDTSSLQWRIVKRLTPRGKALTVVGDDAQAIYKFRGATVDNIRKFERRFKRGARKVTLAQNYRSTQRVIAAANAVIESADDQSKKELLSNGERGSRPRIVAVRDESSQATYVVERAQRLKKEGVSFKDQAVLVRTSSEADIVEHKLIDAGIPYVRWGGRKLLETKHVREFISLLRWFENPRSMFDATRVFQKLPGIGQARAEALFHQVDPSSLQYSSRAIMVPNDARADWASLMSLIAELKRSRHSWPQTIRSLQDWFLKLDARVPKGANLREFGIERLAALTKTYSCCEEFLSGILVDPAEFDPFLGDRLVLSTIHSVKGHEFESVTILSVVEGCIPASAAVLPGSVEEERRVLYVGMTRARTLLEIIVPQRLSRRSATASIGELVSRSRYIDDRAARTFRACST
ncbi:ATP-dependent helicase [Bradyrhizobium sp. WSM4349]|uniref:ATP-dependent helicase n=1 Tax=Bradyrhizobium sp. WSM4349 TaxID=1040988 RepID=UPI0003AABB7A|nr:ATP-dependent helicase [Bradyrhizobium sp. WSM4349]